MTLLLFETVPRSSFRETLGIGSQKKVSQHFRPKKGQAGDTFVSIEINRECAVCQKVCHSTYMIDPVECLGEEEKISRSRFLHLCNDFGHT